MKQILTISKYVWIDLRDSNEYFYRKSSLELDMSILGINMIWKLFRKLSLNQHGTSSSEKVS